MTPENFEYALLRFTRRRRFRPFIVQLVSGESFLVTHPEALTLRDDLAVFVDPQRRHRYFDSDGVCQLCDESI